MKSSKWMVLVVTLGCDGANVETTAQSVVSIESAYARPSEEPLLMIAEQIPEFAGYYCDDGNLVALLVNVGAASGALAELQSLISPLTVSSCFPRVGATHEPTIVLRNANHSFLQLRAWRDQLVDDFFDLDGAVGIGIDYELNQVKMSTEGDPAVVRELASTLAIPIEVVHVEQRKTPNPLYQEYPCPQTASNLLACQTPVPAGVLINATLEQESTAGCTLGPAIARWTGTYWQDGWITNSHCLGDMWSTEGWFVHQTFNQNIIGFEFWDPAGTPCPAPHQSKLCRMSDAAVVWSYPTFSYQAPQRGKIARPVNYDTTALDPNPNLSRFSVVDYRQAAQGSYVDKVGKDTGWTWGNITNTCWDVNQNGTNNRLICQYETTLPADSGDSGSPVFFWRWSGVWEVNAVDIVGVLWGGDGTHTAVSPWANVVQDLGLIASNDPCPTGAQLTGITATASSTESGSYPAGAAVDGIAYTRWSSAFSDPQWIRLDLGTVKRISRVVLSWEAAYATAYKVELSNDGSTWHSPKVIPPGNGGLDSWEVGASARYIRMYGTSRVNPAWGYSLWEFSVFGCSL